MTLSLDQLRELARLVSDHILHIVYYDPFDANEEAYVARRWCELLGKPEEQIAIFYAGMREWRTKRPPIPHYEAADSAHYPDMVQASVRAELTSHGALFIRNLMREYRQEEQDAAVVEEYANARIQAYQRGLEQGRKDAEEAGRDKLAEAVSTIAQLEAALRRATATQADPDPAAVPAPPAAPPLLGGREAGQAMVDRDHKPTAAEIAYGQELERTLSPQTAAVLGPEHTLNTPLRKPVGRDRTASPRHPWKNRVDGKPSNPLPDPDVARERLAQALANGSGGVLVEAVNNPRTLADADERGAELGEIIQALQDMAAEGKMPKQKQWDADKPDGLPSFQTVLRRHGIASWAKLATMAGLEGGRKGGSPGREVTPARQAQLERLKEERRSHRQDRERDSDEPETHRAARPKAKPANVLPSIDDLIAEVRRISMAGIMPTLAQFDESRPALWATADAQLGRHGLTWTQLAEQAGLTPRLGGRGRVAQAEATEA